jgi:hypothetical protein
MSDGRDYPLARFVVQGGGRGAHADQSHGVQAHEDIPVGEPETTREVLRPDVVKSGFAKHGLDGAGLSQAVATVVNGPDVPLSNLAQLTQKRKLLIRPPRAHCQSATPRQCTTHLAGSYGAIREELKSLLTENDIKLLVNTKRKIAGVAFPPIDRGGNTARDGKHLGIHVDPDYRPCRAEAFLRQPSNNTGSTGYVENAIAWSEPNVFKQSVDPGLEQRAYKHLLVDLGETHLGKELLFAARLLRGV